MIIFLPVEYENTLSVGKLFIGRPFVWMTAENYSGLQCQKNTAIPILTWTKFFTVLSIFYKNCLLSGLPHSQSFIFPQKLFYFVSIQDALRNTARNPRAFSWALVTAIARIYIPYAEIIFCANTGRAQWSLGQYHGYQFCLDSTYHRPDWYFQLFYVPSATRKHKMMFLYLSEKFILSPNFPFTCALSILFQTEATESNYLLINIKPINYFLYPKKKMTAPKKH